MLTDFSWRTQFPGLAGVSGALSAALDRESRVARFETGDRIAGPGCLDANLFLLFSGAINVHRHAGCRRAGYRLRAGEGCALAAACLLTFENQPADAVAETEVGAVLLSRAAFEKALSTCRKVRAFVFAAYARRLSDLFAAIDEIEHGGTDIRLAQWLVDAGGAGDTGIPRGRDLPWLLDTSAETVSLQLDRFERWGWIATTRTTIELKNLPALKRLARAAVPLPCGGTNPVPRHRPRPN